MAIATSSGSRFNAAGRARGVALTATAGALYSTAGLFTRLLHMEAWTILAWRGLFGAGFMLVWALIQRGRAPGRAFALDREQGLLILTTALGTVCYIFALKLTTVADVMVVYAAMPFVTALVAWVWVRERPSARMLAASGIALAGVAVMMGSIGTGGRLLGAALAMLMNVTFALALVQAHRRPGSMTVVNGLGVLLASGVAFALAPVEPVTGADIGILALFGILTIGLAMAMFMAGARLIPAAEVGLIAIVDVAIGPALVWLAFGEDPGAPAVFGGVLVVGAVVWHLWPDLRGSA